MQTSLVITSTPHCERIVQPETAAPCAVRRSENMHRLQSKAFLAAFDLSSIAPILAAPPAPATNILLHFSAFASCLDVDYYTALVPIPRFMTLQLHSRAANLWPETYVKSHTTLIALPKLATFDSPINYRHHMQCLSAVLARRISRKMQGLYGGGTIYPMHARCCMPIPK